MKCFKCDMEREFFIKVYMDTRNGLVERHWCLECVQGIHIPREGYIIHDGDDDYSWLRMDPSDKNPHTILDPKGNLWKCERPDCKRLNVNTDDLDWREGRIWKCGCPRE